MSSPSDTEHQHGPRSVGARRTWSERRVRRVASHLVDDAEAIVAAAAVAPSVRPVRAVLVPFTPLWWGFLGGGWAAAIGGLWTSWALLAVVGAVAHIAAVITFMANPEPR